MLDYERSKHGGLNMKIKNEKEIFDLFVEDENGLRYKLKTPFVDKYDGRVWATDAHNLIMVNPECVSGKYETRDMGGKIPVREYNCDESLLVSDLQDALKRSPREPEMKIKYNVAQCPECNGSGEVDVEYYADSDGKYYTISGTCPICDGEGTIEEEEREPTGNMIPKEDILIKFGEGYFKWRLINTIIEACEKLKIEEIRLVRTSISTLNIVELSKDIHIAIMPMYVYDDEDSKKSAIEVKFTK